MKPLLGTILLGLLAIYTIYMTFLFVIWVWFIPVIVIPSAVIYFVGVVNIADIFANWIWEAK